MVIRAASFVPRGSVVLAVTTFGSYALGLVRDRVFAQTFGAGPALDSYNAAFLVPDFFFNLLVASGIAAAAVPLCIELRRRSAHEATAYMSALMLAAAGLMLALSGLLLVLAPWLSQLVAPGLEPEHQQLVAQLMRIIGFSPILFALSNALGAWLVADRQFLFYGLSPLLYNLGIIGGALWLVPYFGVAGIAYGTIVGAALHLGIRSVGAWRASWQWHWNWRAARPALMRTVRLMLPKMLGHPVELVTFWVFTSLASLLATGSITVLNFARNFQSVPVSLLGITMATAVFPQLSEAALESRDELRRLVGRTAAAILAVSTAAAVVLYGIRQPLVAVLLGGGAFDAAAVARTAFVLGIFCLAIPTESLSHLLARSFYALQNTAVPVGFSLVSLVIASASAYWLIGSIGIAGLPLGFFFGSLVKAVGLSTWFWRYSRRPILSRR